MGANVQEGQDVIVACYVEHAEIARAMAREAYRAGAKHVIVLYSDLHVRHAAIELGPEEEIGWSAPHVLDLYRRCVRRAARAHLAHGESGPRPARGSRSRTRRAIRAEGAQGSLAEADHGASDQLDDRVGAQPGMGDQVFGEPDIERLWSAVATRDTSGRETIR